MTAPTPGEFLAERSLYLCTPDRPDLEHFLKECIEGGVDLVQLREKSLEARPLLERAQLAMRVCAEYGVPFILNDRPDLALDLGADGVHVGQDDATPELARRLLGEDRIVGLSTHCSTDLLGSLGAPIDYISVGPVTPTPTKPGRPGTGMGYVLEAAEITSSWSGGLGKGLPFFITGGVTPESIAPLAKEGARRFVVVRYLTEAPHPRRAAQLLRAAIDGIGVVAERA